MSGGYDYDEEEQKLTQELKQIQSEMRRLDAKDDLTLKRAYANPEDADNRMVDYREQHGEEGLFAALRENPERFGDYPDGETHFNDAYQARKELPVTFAQYRRLRDDADIIQTQLDRLRRERDELNREDDEGPKR